MAIRVFNNNFSQNCVIRVDTSFPIDHFAVSYMVYFDTLRSGQFRTTFSYGPTSFSGTQYQVAFAGNGVISNNWAIGSQGADTYHGSIAPVAGRWYRQVYRRRKIGTGNYEQLFYFDVPSLNNVSRNETTAETTPASGQLNLMAVPWTTGEGVDGRIANMMVFSSGNIPIKYLMQQTLSYQLLDRKYKNLVWASWRGLTKTDLQDKSIHKRVGSILDAGTDISSISHPPSLLSFREPKSIYPFDTGVSGSQFTTSPSGLITNSGSLSGFVKLPKYTVKIG